MSKRFGRNQRRKLREQLAEYEAENSRMGNKLVVQGRDNRVMQRQLDALKAYLGKNHPMFPPSGFDPGFKPQPEDQFYLRGAEGQPEAAMVMRFGRPSIDDHSRDVHFMLYAGQDRIGYALTEHALHNMPLEHLARNMASAMVDLLLATIRKEPRR